MKNQTAKSLAVVLALVLGMTCTQFASAQAHCDADYTDSSDYDNGFNPRVALTGKNVVEVHNAGVGVGPLWYHVGKLSKTNSNVQWGGSHEYESSGENPAVAISGKTVVEVHNSVDGVGALEYVVGTLNASDYTITWGNTVAFDNGYNPTIAIVGTKVIEVHNAKTGVGPLWYSTGTVNAAAKTIAWATSSQYDNGFNPSVAASGTQVLEVHNGGSGAPVPLLVPDRHPERIPRSLGRTASNTLPQALTRPLVTTARPFWKSTTRISVAYPRCGTTPRTYQGD